MRCYSVLLKKFGRKEKNLQLTLHPSQGQQNVFFPSDYPLLYLHCYHFWSLKHVQLNFVDSHLDKISLQSSKFSFGFGSTCATRCKFLGRCRNFRYRAKNFRRTASNTWSTYSKTENTYYAPKRAAQVLCCNTGLFQQH